MTTIRRAFATAALTAAVGLTGLTLYDAGHGDKEQLRKDCAVVATFAGLGFALGKSEAGKKQKASQAPVPGVEYQQMTVSFTEEPLWARFPLPFPCPFPVNTFYSKEFSLLVPTEAVPELERWRAQNLRPGEKGEGAMIEFLKQKGALLHNETGPAYTVLKWRICGPDDPRQEEYWIKGKQVAAPIPPIESAKEITLQGKMRF